MSRCSTKRRRCDRNSSKVKRLLCALGTWLLGEKEEGRHDSPLARFSGFHLLPFNTHFCPGTKVFIRSFKSARCLATQSGSSHSFSLSACSSSKIFCFASRMRLQHKMSMKTDFSCAYERLTFSLVSLESSPQTAWEVSPSGCP